LYKKILFLSLVIFLFSCEPIDKSLPAIATDFSASTQTRTSVSLGLSVTPSSTPDLFSQILFSPNGKYVAKRYDPYLRSPFEKPAIEIFNEQGKLLWRIPYQGEMPIGDPRPSLSIYKWAIDSSKLYFYYAFHGDGGYTLTDGFNL